MQRFLASASVRDSNTSARLRDFLPENRWWRGTRWHTPRQDSAAAPFADLSSQRGSASACTRCLPARRGIANRAGISARLPRTPVSPGPIFPGERGPARAENPTRETDSRGLAQAVPRHPSTRHRRRSARQQDGPDPDLSLAHKPREKKGAPLRKEGKTASRSFLRNRQQHPIAVGPPLFFEVNPFYAKKFATSGVMDKHRVVLPVDARNHYVVQRRFGAARLKAHNQRAPLLQMFLKIRPSSVQKEHLKSRATEIILHAGGEDTARLA